MGCLILKNALQSIKKQKYKSIEHIIIYSKSTDKTLEFLKKNKLKFYYDKKSKNKFDAINVGIKKAKGKYIAYYMQMIYFIIKR